MTRRLPTASRLYIVQNCAAAAWLPTTKRKGEFAEHGNEIHAFFQDANEHGVEDALRSVPREKRAFYETLTSPAYRSDGARYAAEVAFAYDIETGKARELHRGGSRDYSSVQPTEFCGTADVVGLMADAVVVADYKSGLSTSQPAAAHNPQLKSLALMAARTYGKYRAIVEIISVPFGGGEPYVDAHEMDAFELDTWELELVGLLKRVQETWASAEMPEASIGGWCKYCDCLPNCPAQARAIMAAAGNPIAFQEQITAQLDPTTVARAYHLLKGLKEYLGHVEQAIHAFAKHHPIELGGGVVLSEVEGTRDRIVDPKLVYQFLKARFGEEVAKAACPPTTTKEAIKEVMTPVCKENGFKLKDFLPKLFEELRRQGALVTQTTRSVREHKLKVLPP